MDRHVRSNVQLTGPLPRTDSRDANPQLLSLVSPCVDRRNLMAHHGAVVVGGILSSHHNKHHHVKATIFVHLNDAPLYDESRPPDPFSLTEDPSHRLFTSFVSQKREM